MSHPENERLAEQIFERQQEVIEDLLETCKSIEKFYQDNMDIMPVAFQTYANMLEFSIKKAEAL